MIYLIDGEPGYCPNCGEKFPSTPESRRDFYAGASSSCHHCGAACQHASRLQILEASKATGGDLHVYAGRFF